MVTVQGKGACNERWGNVRFPSNSDHRADIAGCLKCAQQGTFRALFRAASVAHCHLKAASGTFECQRSHTAGARGERSALDLEEDQRPCSRSRRRGHCVGRADRLLDDVSHSQRGGHHAARRLAMLYSNPRIDTLAVVISVGHRISVRPFATAIFCVPLTE